MAVDPRLDMLDNAEHPGRGQGGKLADLWRRVKALERRPVVQVGTGNPVGTAREGTLYIDSANLKLWAYVAGGWHSATLT